MAGDNLQAKLDALTPAQREQLKRVLAARRAAASGGARSHPEVPAASARTRGIPRAPDSDDYPLSFAQKRLWLQEQLIEGKTAAYNVSLAVRVTGPLVLDALERSFRSLIGRHPVLRTVIVRGETEPRQKILPSCEWHVERWSGSGDPAGFERRAGEYANRPFDLENELPVRVACMPLGNQEHGIVVVFHHIACDGSSVPVLLRELERCYAESAQPSTTTQEPLSIGTRYVDYAVWHREWLQSKAAAAAREWWLKQFAELPEPVELPVDRPRPSVQDFSGAHHFVTFDAATRERVAQLAQRSGASVFMTLHAVVVAFLHRFAGWSDMTIGVPTEGRFHPDLDGLVGFFVNTLPLRNRVDPHEPFLSLLARVKSGVLDAFEHQAFPFDGLVDALKLDRDLSRPPLFNVMMGVNRADDEALRLPGTAATPVPLKLGASKVDLTFHFLESASGLELDLEYATALFSDATIRRTGSYFEAFLTAVLEAPQTCVGDLPLMEPGALRAVIDGFNPPRRPFPAIRSMIDLFLEQVRRDPEADAVYFEGRTFSYAEIDRLSDQVAAHIVSAIREIRPDEPIAVQVERSERMIAALLGILKAGGCYLPINPGTPVERTRTLLTMAAVRLRLVEDEAAVAGWSGRDIDLRDCCAKEVERAEERAERGTRTALASALAYIIFTSGSTGEPKGVLVEQRSVVRLVRDTDFLQVGPGDRVLQTGSLAFDASTFEIWAPLLNGGCCCLPKGKELLEIAEFGGLLDATGASICFLTTGLFNQIASFYPDAFTRLRCLLTGGEKVSVAHMKRVLEHAPGIRLLHVYGPTENTTFSSWHLVRDIGHDVPIGGAIAHSTLYVLDERGNLLPPGVVGEIYCGGEGIARGYLGRPELTAERFVPDPFSHLPGARLYRTGDYGRWNDGGSVEFIGRNDDQVKIRGFRIELGEIELRLRAIPSVEQAVVVARPAGGTHELVAYVVCRGESASPDSLRAALGETLPDYMVPAHVVFLKELPLNSSGKVDRRALPAPVVAGGAGEASAPAAWSSVPERVLAGVWADVLGRGPSGRDAHYFNAGGDSIKAIQMSARLRAQGYKLTLRDVFAKPKFGDMAAALVTAAPPAAATTEGAEGEVQLSPIQQWFLETYPEPYGVFNQATLLQARERLDPDRVRVTLTRLVARHPMLRCSLRRGPSDGRWRQVITSMPSDGAAFIWREVDLRQADDAARAFEAGVCALHEEVSLAEGRLVAAGLFHHEREDRLLLVIHHWAVDGVSWRILLEDFEAIYRSLDGGRDPSLPGSASFTSWVDAMRRYAASDDALRQVDYWTRVCASDTVEPLPEGPTVAERPREFVLDENLTRALLRESRQAYGTQVSDLLLAALSKAWEDVGLMAKPLLAMEGHGREGCVPVDVSHTVGWFTSMWPFRLSGSGDWPRRVREVKDALRAVPDHGFGYGVLRYLGNSGHAAVLRKSPPRVSFNYLGEFGDSDGGLFSGVLDTSVDAAAEKQLRSRFALDIVIDVVEGRLRATLHFHRALMDDGGREALVTAFERCLRECIEHCRHAEPALSVADVTGGVRSVEELDRVTNALATEHRTVEDILPVTPLQEGMIFHALREPGSPAYSDQVVMRLTGPLDPKRFQRAWEGLGAQYPNLRATFRTDLVDRPLAVILRDTRLGFSFVEHTPECTVENVAAAERAVSFDLAAGPLLRLTLVRVAADVHDAILGFHHTILDGWSSGLVWRMLEANYKALGGGRALPHAEGDFRDYVRWLAARDARQDLDEWKQALTGCAPGAVVPPGVPRLGAPPLRTRAFVWSLGRERTERLQVAARTLGTTESALFQALWGVFLGKLTGASDVVFGATMSGRNGRVANVEAIVGMLINTVPVRVAWDRETTFSQLAERVREQTAAGLERVGASLADIEAQVLERGSLIQHTLVFENYPDDGTAEAERVWKTETLAIHDPMHFEFGMLVVPRREGWVCRIIADEFRYPDAYLRELQRIWEHAVDQCICAPDTGLSSWGLNPTPTRCWRIACAATFTAEPIAEPLEFWSDALGLKCSIAFAPYNQVLQALLDPGSELHRVQRGARVLLIRLQDWIGAQPGNTEAVERSLARNGTQLVAGVRALVDGPTRAPVVVVFCPSSAETRGDEALSRTVLAAEARIAAALEGVSTRTVGTVRSADLLRAAKTVPVDNSAAEELGGVPYTEAFFAVVASATVRRIDALTRPPLKVLALDADNTLWRGVLGEDGAEGIQLTPALRHVQETARRAMESGLLLALVTKNNPDDVREVFAQRLDFPLRWEDFVAVKAGWGAKSAALRELGRSLNLGVDSFVFLDDSPLECADVRAALPEVLTLQLPAAEEAIATFVDGCWAFDFAAATAEDRSRTELYRAEARRDAARAGVSDLAGFIRQMELEVRAVAIGPENLARAAQLTQRTNQFNASTVRRTDSEVRSFLETAGNAGFLVEVSDRFGAYGLSGCVLYRRGHGILDVDTFLLSCRVLGRGVEHWVLRHLGELAQNAGAASLRILFTKTQKNAPAEQFLQTFATRVESGAFVFDAERARVAEVAAGGSEPGAMPEVGRNTEVAAAVGSPAASLFHQAVAAELGSAEGLLDAIDSWNSRRRSRAASFDYQPPVGEREAQIAAIWAEVLGVPRVGRRDDFFALGGHSLRAVMMLSRINRVLGVNVDLEAVFSAPVLSDFASHIAARTRSADQGIDFPAPVAGAPDYPVSDAQRRLWMIEQMRGAGPSPFHMSAVFRVSRALDIDRLTVAFARLIRRHESLRTGIVERAGVPRQVIAAATSFAIERIDGTAGDPVAEFIERAFDLSQPPLLRVGLIDCAPSAGPTGGSSDWTLVVVMHHIVSDGWSIGVMADELAAVYREPGFNPPPLAIQYKDYAVWQTEQLAAGRLERSGGYWRSLFAKLPPPLEMPTDRVRPAVKQSRGSEVVASCAGRSWESVKRAASECGASPFMALVAALQVLLARQAGADRFVIGTPVAGRHLAELETQVGFYVNLVPLVAEVNGADTFAAHLAQVKRSVATALSHAQYPFDRLVDELHLERDMSRSPLFDVLIVFQSNRTAELTLEGVEVCPVERDSRTAQYDLTFEFAETENGLRLRVEYDTGLFEKRRIERLAAELLAGLTNAFASPATKVEDLVFATGEEIDRICALERGARFGAYSGVSVSERFSAVAARNRGRAALAGGGDVVTYGELATRADTIAAEITRRGIPRQVPIAVAGERSEAFVAAMLGVMRAGCIFLPLELKHPDERLRHVVTDAGATCAIAIGAEAEQRLSGLGLQLVSPSHAGEAARNAAPEPPSHEDLAYIIYTSGSTGRPKGVEITHGAFVTMIESQIEAFGIVPDDRCGWWASCAFDATLSELFLALASGGCVVIAGDPEREDGHRYREWLHEQRVTVATLPPAFLRVLNRASLKPLRVLITAGEAADPGDASYYSSRLHYFNAYGPTETSVCATVHRVLPSSDPCERPTSIPVGNPLSVAAIYILDPQRRRVPFGARGEIFIGGRIVGRGYRNAPDLTRERFVQDPFADETGARMYRTGDIGRWKSDGTLEFLGREDGQVKIRGFRIELGEIEAVLRSIPGVRDAMVLPMQRHGGAVLVGYVVANPALESALRGGITERLPDYMRPAAYVWLDALPMNSNGKLDKSALPVPTFGDCGAVTAPQGAVEETLAAAWRRCLGVQRIGRESDFFALGGDSIKALSLVGALRTSGWALTLKAIYACPRLAEQAERLVAVKDEDSGRRVHGTVPMLPIQSWFLVRHADSPLHHFNQAVCYRTAATVDLKRLQRAVTEIWRHHPSLRATFEQGVGGWMQVIRAADHPEPQVALVDLRGLPEESARSRETAWIKDAQEGFDLARGPLVRYGLLRRDALDRIVCVTHHLVSDWVSHRVLLADLNHAYAGGGLVPAAAETGDWVRSAMAWARDSDARESAVAYWQRRAMGWPAGAVPAPGRYGEVSIVSRELSLEQTLGFKHKAATVTGATVRDILLAGMACAGSPVDGVEALAVQLEGHGRESLGDDLDMSRTVGWFTSLYPFLASRVAGEDFGRTAARMCAALRTTPHAGASFGVLRAYADDVGLPELPTMVGFNYLGEFAREGDGAMFELDAELPPGAISPSFERDNPIDVSAWIFDGKLCVQVAFVEKVTPAHRIEEWIDAALGAAR